MAEKKSIPGASLPEIKKIIEGYASSRDAMSLDDVSKKVGMLSTFISRNTKFLGDLGLLTTGAQKQATDAGRRYARALEHKQEDAARKLLADLVKQNEFLSDLVTTIRIKNGMQSSDFTQHILYAANQANNGANRTGANAIEDLLVESGLVEESDGQLAVATAPSTEDDDAAQRDREAENEGVNQGKQTVKERIVFKEVGSGNHPQLTINITLQIPEVEDPDVYDRFFKAMKMNLFPDG